MRAAQQLRDTLGCEPTVEQIAAACELSVEDITLSMSASMEVESIYKTIYQGDGSEVMLMDKLEDKADIGEAASSKVALAQLMETLSQREKNLSECAIMMIIRRCRSLRSSEYRRCRCRGWRRRY